MSKHPPVDPEHPYRSIAPSKRALAGFVLALSNFMVVLDLTIANVSVPHISGDVGASLDQGTWIITSYAVAEAITVPLTGWLAQRFGAVRLFVLAMLGFGFFSLLCGLSQSLGVIVICRVGQGLCGGPLMPMSQTLLMRVFPPEKRAVAMGLWAMTMTLGPAFGPILGGVISDNLSWHWIFLINVPIAVLISFGSYLLLSPVETETRKVPIDRVGLGLLVLWIGCLQILLDLGRDRDWFNDPEIVALGVVAAIGFSIFVIWELTEEHPIVDLRVFRHRGFTITVITLALCFGAFFSGVVVIPQWLQATLGYSATQAGFVTAVNAFAAVMVSPLVARLMPHLDQRAMVCGGATWMGITALIRAHWPAGADMFSYTWPLFMQGLDIPFMFIPLTGMAMAAVNPREMASAAGLQNFMRTMAIAVATSTVLTIWTSATTTSRDMLVGRIHPDAARASLAGLGMGAEQTRGYISALVDKEAITIAIDHVFVVAAVVMFLGAAVVWLVPRVKPPAPGEAPIGH